MSEHDQQSALFEWAEHRINRGWKALELMYAIPNGGERNVIVATRLKAEGVKPGVPDVCIPIPKTPYHSLYIEMKDKDTKGSKVKPHQEKWINNLRLAGHQVEVCWDWIEAAQVICGYLGWRFEE